MQPVPPRILFLPASGPGVGGGHVLRCLALAQALEARGAVVAFGVEAEGGRLLMRFAPGAATLQGTPQVAEDWGAETVVFDDYGRDAQGEATFERGGRLIVAIDDLADRPHRATLLIDPTYGRDPSAYSSLLPPGSQVLAGAEYALLRREFANASPRPSGTTVQRLFIGFGLADPGGVTARAVGALLPALPACAFDVVVGAGASSVPNLQELAEREPRLTLHIETDRAADLMAAADLAIGGGGASTWERFRLALPSVCVVVADNQRALAHALSQAGAQLTIEADDPAFEVTLTEAVLRLASEPDLRAELASNGAALCDGRGAERAAAAILAAISRR